MGVPFGAFGITPIL